jgi:hypothetical protein
MDLMSVHVSNGLSGVLPEQLWSKWLSAPLLSRKYKRSFGSERPSLREVLSRLRMTGRGECCFGTAEAVPRYKPMSPKFSLCPCVSVVILNFRSGFICDDEAAELRSAWTGEGARPHTSIYS